MPEAPAKVMKSIAPTLPPPVTKFVVPYIETVHTRAPIEIMRGCTRGCRFCHAGMITRPVRERPVQEILDAMDEILESTGYEEIALCSPFHRVTIRMFSTLPNRLGRKYGHLGTQHIAPIAANRVGQHRANGQSG